MDEKTIEFRVRDYGISAVDGEVFMIDRKINGVLGEGIRLTKDELMKVFGFIVEKYPELKRKVYDQERFKYTKQDVEMYLEDNEDIKALDLSDEEYDSFVEGVAQRYVDGRYDCNLSYWQNLDNLINEAKEAV